MAVTCDPSVLANNARCFTQCIPAGDQLAVQAYLAAQIALALGAVTSADPSVLANAAGCFECVIPVGDQLAAQNFLIANSLSLTDPAALAAAATCFSCTIPWGDEMAVQTYLLATISFNVGANTSLDPSTLANAARCWASCIPPGEWLAVQNYLWCQISPVCATPNVPINLVATPHGSSIVLTWTEPLGSPAGVTSFLVRWGTSSGNYNLGSATVSGNTPNFTITGLTPQTAYFMTVTAVNGACSSSASAELSATTTRCDVGVDAVSDWATRVLAAGGALPSSAVQLAMQDLVCGLKTDGILNQVLYMDVFPPTAVGSVTSNAANWAMTRTPLIKVIGANTGTGAPQAAGEFTIAGASGDGISHFLDPGINPSTMFTNWNSIGWLVYMTVDANDGGNDMGSGINANGQIEALVDDGVGDAFSTIGIATNNRVVAVTKGAGFYSGQRVSTTNHRLYYASSVFPHAQLPPTDALLNTSSPPNLPLVWFCENTQNGLGNFTASRYSAVGITTGMTQPDNAKLFTRIDNFRRAVGGGFI
jgi:hypothetical protein